MLLEDIYIAIGLHYAFFVVILFETHILFAEERFPWFKTAPTGWKVKSFQSDLCAITKYHYFSARYCRTLSATTYPSILLSKRCPGL